MPSVVDNMFRRRIMRPTQLRHRAAVPALFVSCKCEIPVPIQHQPLLRYALEQAALDPAVQAIRYRKGPIIECPRFRCMASFFIASTVASYLGSTKPDRKLTRTSG